MRRSERNEKGWSDLAVDQHADDDRVDHRDHRSFRRREYSAENAAENDDRQQQRPQRLPQRTCAVAPGDAGLRFEPQPFGIDAKVEHQCCRHDQGRQEARGKQGGDRRVGDASIDNHGQAGRHENAHPRGGGHQRSRVTRAKSVALHRRDHHRADGGRVRVGRAGDAGKEQHRDQHHVAETAADVTNQHARQCHQPLRDPSRLHQIAGENEERDGEQRKIIDAGEDAARHDAQRRTLDEPQTCERCRPKRKRDRDTCCDEGSKQRECGGHSGSLRMSRMCMLGERMKCIARWKSMRPAPVGSAR